MAGWHRGSLLWRKWWESPLRLNAAPQPGQITCISGLFFRSRGVRLTGNWCTISLHVELPHIGVWNFFYPIALTISRILFDLKTLRNIFETPPSPLHFQPPSHSFALSIPIPLLCIINTHPPPLHYCISIPLPSFAFLIPPFFLWSFSFSFPFRHTLTLLRVSTLFFSLTNWYPDTQFTLSTFSPSQIPSVQKHGQTSQSNPTGWNPWTTTWVSCLYAPTSISHTFYSFPVCKTCGHGERKYV